MPTVRDQIKSIMQKMRFIASRKSQRRPAAARVLSKQVESPAGSESRSNQKIRAAEPMQSERNLF